jgi:hypothetical protein
LQQLANGLCGVKPAATSFHIGWFPVGLLGRE